MTDTELAWIAGIVDGEGCIKLNHDSRTDSHSLELEIPNTHKSTIDRLFNLTRIGFPYEILGENNRKIRYVFSVCGDNTNYFLNLCKPYIFTKRKQMEVALNWFKKCFV